MEPLPNEQVPMRYGPKGTFSLVFIKRVIGELEQGAGMQDTRRKYGLSCTLIRCWLTKYAPALSIQFMPRKFSSHEKRSVCQSVREGRLTVAQAAISYGTGRTTIYDWLRMENDDIGEPNMAGLKKKSTKPSVAQSPAEDVRLLQEQLANANLKIAALNTLIDVAEEQLKINIRKKPGAKQS